MRAAAAAGEFGEIGRRQIVELDADARRREPVALEQIGEHRHGVEGELAPHRDLDASPRLGRIVFASMSTTTSAPSPSAVTSAMAWRQRISGWVGDRKPVT